MAFAPIWIPFKRRVQTLAAMIGVWIAFFAHANGVIIWFLLFFTPLWPIPVIYATFACALDYNTSSRGGRRINFVRRLRIWDYFCEYFPIKLVKTAHLDKKRNYIFGFHPHGIISAGAFGNFATEGSKFTETFPGIKPHLLTLKIMFKFPFFRDMMLAFGLCDVSKESIQKICQDKGGGNAAIIIVGGAAESLDARPGSCTMTLKDRKGFIRMAIKTGANLVPVFSFGENELYKQVYNPRGSRLRRIQERVQKWMTFAPVIFYGRGIFQYNFGFLPFRRAITTVVGAPIPIVRKEDPSVSDVNQIHDLYIKRLKELFDRHKLEYSSHPDAVLDIM